MNKIRYKHRYNRKNLDGLNTKIYKISQFLFSFGSYFSEDSLIFTLKSGKNLSYNQSWKTGHTKNVSSRYRLSQKNLKTFFLNGVFPGITRFSR